MSKERVSIEQLVALHVQLYGDHPEYEFWTWLGACSVGYTDEDLNKFYEEMKGQVKK